MIRFFEGSGLFSNDCKIISVKFYSCYSKDQTEKSNAKGCRAMRFFEDGRNRFGRVFTPAIARIKQFVSQSCATFRVLKPH